MMSKRLIPSVLSVFLVFALAMANQSCSKSEQAGSVAMSPEAAKVASDDMGAEARYDAKEKDSGAKGEGKKTWKRSTLAANTSRLMIGDTEELAIRGMQVHARVDGFRARVLIDFYFANDHDRRYEGTFKMRLPEGASPYYLAFGQSKFEDARYLEAKKVRDHSFSASKIAVDRDAEWIEPKVARMVPKEQAARAYGNVVRRQVDPALMEWAGAGVFNARIFPIEPRKLHRVVVGYDMDLTRIGDDLEMQLPIPENLPSSAVDLDIVNLPGGSIAVTTVAPGAQGGGAVKGSRDGPRSYYRLDGVQGKVVMARLKNVGAVALVGGDGSQESDLLYFAAQVAPSLPAGSADGGPTRSVFAVDTSLSSNPDKFNVWLALLRAMLDNNRKGAGGAGSRTGAGGAGSGGIQEFAVVFFNIETRWWQPRFVANTPENVSRLLAEAGELALEGATDLGAVLSEAAAPPWLAQDKSAPYNVFLLSDGAATWGQGDAYALSTALSSNVAALFAYRTGMSGSDTRMLEHLTRESGGAVFSVVGESEVAAASRAHTTRPWALLEVSVVGRPGDDQAGVDRDLLIAGRPRAIFPGQRLTVVGRRAIAQGVRLVFELERGGQSKKVAVALDAAVDSPLAARAYGQLAVGQLEEFLGSTQSFAEAYARHFRVTGKSTSLLMLESERDYRQYGIVPADDAGVVTRVQASVLFAEARERLAQVLGDPRHAFLQNSKLPVAVRDVLAQLPASAFEVAVPRLVARQRTWSVVPAGLRAQLDRRKPEYDTVVRDAENRREKFGAADGLKALSSLIEANPGDAVLARDIGFTAMEWGLHGQAYHLFRRVAESRPYEPQTYLAMALALAEIGQGDLALGYFEIGMEGQWDARFGEFKRIIMMDYMRFLGQGKGLSPATRSYAKKRLTDLRRLFGVDSADLLITIMWNTDNTDVDLHVIEPSGEECYYGHSKTRSGGHISQDVTQGYGPEMYTLARAPRGTYQVRAHYFASDANRASARSKIYATIYRNWGTPDEKVTREVVTLAYGKDKHDLATVIVK